MRSPVMLFLFFLFASPLLSSDVYQVKDGQAKDSQQRDFEIAKHPKGDEARLKRYVERCTSELGDVPNVKTDKPEKRGALVPKLNGRTLKFDGIEYRYVDSVSVVEKKYLDENGRLRVCDNPSSALGSAVQRRHNQGFASS